MAATLAILKGGGVISEMQHLVAQAGLALTLANGISPTSPVAENPYPARPPAKLETNAHDSVMDRKNTGSTMSANMHRTMVDPTAPKECLEDPFTELRVWSEAENGHPAVMWPYCTKCRCWTDLNHHRSKNHQKALATVHPGATPPEDCQKANAALSHTITNTQPVNAECVVQVNPNRSINYTAAAQHAYCMQQQGIWMSQMMQTPWPLHVSPSLQFASPCVPHAWPRSFEQPLQLPGHRQACAPTAAVPGPHRPWSHAIDSTPWSLPKESGDSVAGPSTDSAATAGSCFATPVASAVSPNSSFSQSEFAETHVSKMNPSLEVPVALPGCRWGVYSTAATSWSEAETQ